MAINTRVFEQHRKIMAAGDLVQTITNLDTSAGSQDSVFGISGGSNQSVSSLESQENKDFKLLRSSCTMQKILEAMRNPNTGISFISKTSPLSITTLLAWMQLYG